MEETLTTLSSEQTQTVRDIGVLKQGQAGLKTDVVELKRTSSWQAATCISIGRSDCSQDIERETV